MHFSCDKKTWRHWVQYAINFFTICGQTDPLIYHCTLKVIIIKAKGNNNMEQIQDSNHGSAGEVTPLNSRILRLGDSCNIFNSAMESRFIDPSMKSKSSRLLNIGI